MGTEAVGKASEGRKPPSADGGVREAPMAADQVHGMARLFHFSSAPLAARCAFPGLAAAAGRGRCGSLRPTLLPRHVRPVGSLRRKLLNLLSHGTWEMVPAGIASSASIGSHAGELSHADRASEMFQLPTGPARARTSGMKAWIGSARCRSRALDKSARALVCGLQCPVAAAKTPAPVDPVH